MEQEIQKDPEELYQEQVKEEQELLGYCKKIKQGIENLDENSGERAIWELTQNARDVAENEDCTIKIVLKDDKFVVCLLSSNHCWRWSTKTVRKITPMQIWQVSMALGL